MPNSLLDVARRPLAALLTAAALLGGCGGGADADSAPAERQFSSDNTMQAATASPPDARATILAASVTFPAAVAPKTYFVDSAAGNDSNDGSFAAQGVAPAGPWRSLAKLASVALNPGDTVNLNCGSVWKESLRIGNDGTQAQPIKIAASPAGCANPPVIDGSTAVAPSAWTAESGSIYRAALDAPPLFLRSSAGQLNLAHHPNRGYDPTRPRSPYLTNAVDSDSTIVGGKERSTYVTMGSDLQLPPGTAITAGTKIHIRTKAWIIDETTVSAVEGNRLRLATPTLYRLMAGWGYFLLGQRWMLDSPSEWFYDPAAKMLYARMPNSAAPAVPVYAAQLATGVDLRSRRFVWLTGVSVRLVGTGVDMRGSTGVVVRNTKIEDTDAMGIDASSTTSAVIDANVVSRTGYNGISGTTDGASIDAVGMRITYNNVLNAGVVMNGDVMTSLPRASFAAIRATTGAIVYGNVVRDSGSIGIRVMAGSTVSKNYVYGACSVLDDCGGIYTSGTNNGSVISNNVVQLSRGAVDGKPPEQSYTQAQGIYLDESASGVTVNGNTATEADSGIQIHVSSNNTITNNNLFGNRNNQLWLHETRNSENPAGDVFGNVITGNQIVPTSPTARGILQQTSVSNSTASFAQYDFNRYFDRLYSRVALESTATTQQDYTFPTWNGATLGNGQPRNLDPNGRAASAHLFAAYTVTGASIVPNGNFAAGISGWRTWNQTAPLGTLSGSTCGLDPCAQYSAGATTSLLSSPFFSVQQGQWYRLSIDVRTGANSQLVQMVLRRGGGGVNGYESLSNIGLNIVGSQSFKRYSFLFVATKSVNANDAVTGDLGARLDLQLQPGQSLTIANVEIVPTSAADATTRTDLLLNAGLPSATVACPAASSNPTACSKYVRLSDAAVVTWPYPLAGRSSEIVYTLDSTLLDSDGDGIADSQDMCPGTVGGSAVNSVGCSIVQP